LSLHFSTTLALNIHNESSPLKTVVFGTKEDVGGTPTFEDCLDSQSTYQVKNHSFFALMEILFQMNAFYIVLSKCKVEVYRPVNISGLNQISKIGRLFRCSSLLFLSA
tara:strand:- start:20 stop:343 length:324 start_codon:yes stop_codon:yes gene_type:complete